MGIEEGQSDHLDSGVLGTGHGGGGILPSL